VRGLDLVIGLEGHETSSLGKGFLFRKHVNLMIKPDDTKLPQIRTRFCFGFARFGLAARQQNLDLVLEVRGKDLVVGLKGNETISLVKFF